MKKFIEKLSNSELEKVFNNNKKLREQVRDRALDSEHYYISDILRCFQGNAIRDYSIGIGRPSYMNVGEVYKFEEGVLKACKDFGILSDKEEKEFIEKMGEFQKEIEAIEEEDGDNVYDDCLVVEDEVEAYLQTIADQIVKMMVGWLEYKYDGEGLYEEFLENYLYDMEEDFYYVDCEDYILKSDTTITYN